MHDQPTHPLPPKISPESKRPSRQTTPENWRSVLSTIVILLIAPLVALLLMAFVFQSYQVDGPSMQTTLQQNDRLIVWKTPRTWARITGNPYIPERGDIIVFVEPDLNDLGQNANKQLIKRVVALPGERVVVKDGALTVYNKEHPDGFQPDKTLPYGSVIQTTPGELDTLVPDDHIFVAGDNRSNSLDSRAFGPVNADNIVGKLSARIFPLGEAQRF